MESESDPLTRRAIDLFKKEPLKGNSEVHLHTPTKFGEDRSKDLGGDREQTDRQTDKRCSIYSMIRMHFKERNLSHLCYHTIQDPSHYMSAHAMISHTMYITYTPACAVLFHIYTVYHRDLLRS